MASVTNSSEVPVNLYVEVKEVRDKDVKAVSVFVNEKGLLFTSKQKTHANTVKKKKKKALVCLMQLGTVVPV